MPDAPENTRTCFGLEVVDGWFVRYEDIARLPFYAFWEESMRGSTCRSTGEGVLVNLADWVAFAQLFIATGKHRYQS